MTDLLGRGGSAAGVCSDGYEFPYWLKGLAALGRRQLRVSSLRCGPLRRRHQTCVGWLVGRAITPVHDSDDAEQSVGGGGGPTWRVGSVLLGVKGAARRCAMAPATLDAEQH